MKKMISLVLAIMMVAVVGLALAQEETYSGSDAGNATITVENASKGEIYKVVKLFNASVTGTANGAIAYTGDIPDALASLFWKDSAGNIYPYRVADTEGRAPGSEGYVNTFAASFSADQFNTMKTWADGQTATASAESDGSALKFKNLPYGYYIVVSTQGATVTVDSTNPNATIRDKNTKTPTAGKTVNDADVYVGETVTYTLTFDTTNWLGAGDAAKQVVKYEIADTLPNYLSDVTVTTIKIDSDGNTETTEDQTALTVQQFSNKKITIDWATGNHTDGYTNTYKNGSKIIITYTAKVNENVNVGDADGNRNVVTLTPYVDDGEDNPKPSQETVTDDETIKTYGAALYKVDENGQPLAGATFAVKGLTTTGSNGEYTVTAFDANSESFGTTMECDTDGVLIILGLASDVNLTVQEVEAPAGYNKLTETVTLEPIKMSETVSFTEKTVYYDSDNIETRKVVHEEVTGGSTKTVTATGNDLKANAKALKVENQKGVELPSTGGIGTTIFYIVGGLLLVGAAIVLVARRKAEN